MQAGIVKYGRNAWIEINFDEFPTEKDLIDNINGIKHDNANESRLDLALKLATDRLFLRSRGAKAERVGVHASYFKRCFVILYQMVK